MSTAREKQHVRNIIKELRENRGYTYQKISDTLMAEYGIKCTRQNVHQIYSRMSGNVKTNNIDIDVSDTKINLIITLKAYGEKSSTMMGVLKNSGCKLNRTAVRKLIMYHSTEVITLRERIIHKSFEVIQSGGKVRDIINMLSFGGYKPSLIVIKGILDESSLGHTEVLRLLREYKENME